MEKKTDFKTLSAKAKIEYIWDYYKWPILIVIAVAATVIYLIHNAVTYREPVLNAIMINCNHPSSADASGFDEFLTEYGYSPEDQPVSLNSSLQFPDDGYSLSYNDFQVLAALIGAGGQDLFFGTGDVFLAYAEQGALEDLTSVLPEDLLEKYQDQLIYAEYSDTSTLYPCAIELTGNEWLKKYDYYDTCYFGIFYQAKNPDTAIEFAEFLLNH